MKKIYIKYTIEVPEDTVDKVCSITNMGRKHFATDTSHLAEISGRHRVYEFIQGILDSRKGVTNEEKAK